MPQNFCCACLAKRSIREPRPAHTPACEIRGRACELVTEAIIRYIAANVRNGANYWRSETYKILDSCQYGQEYFRGVVDQVYNMLIDYANQLDNYANALAR